jgi:hypothetical protein
MTATSATKLLRYSKPASCSDEHVSSGSSVENFRLAAVGHMIKPLVLRVDGDDRVQRKPF